MTTKSGSQSGAVVTIPLVDLALIGPISMAAETVSENGLARRIIKRLLEKASICGLVSQRRRGCVRSPRSAEGRLDASTAGRRLFISLTTPSCGFRSIKPVLSCANRVFATERITGATSLNYSRAAISGLAIFAAGPAITAAAVPRPAGSGQPI